jgi:hypothetical protein
VKKHNAEKAAKGFRCRTQLVAMLFCQLAHAESLREICNGLACCLGKLVHLGIDVAPSKSTLSYANQHRPAKLYEELFYRNGRSAINAKEACTNAPETIECGERHDAIVERRPSSSKP